MLRCMFAFANLMQSFNFVWVMCYFSMDTSTRKGLPRTKPSTGLITIINQQLKQSRCLSVLGVAWYRYIRGRTNYVQFQLCITSTLPFLRYFVFACHQVIVLPSLLVKHFLLGNVPRVHLCLQCSQYLFQNIGITVYTLTSHL